MAAAIKVDRTGLYRKPTKQGARDQTAGVALLAAHTANPFYGVRRLRIVLEWSTNKTRRIRQLTGVSATLYRKTNNRQAAPMAEIPAPGNALRPYVQPLNPDRPQAGQTYIAMANESGAWVQDFTHVRCGRQWYYLAAVIELASRRVVGWSVGAAHDTSLTLSALKHALGRHTPPPILHSDQGSEYLSYAHRDTCEAYEMTLSCSSKSSPWQNGFMESFFGKFKPELGSPSGYATPETLFERVAKNMHYYNHERIHSALGMSPAAYAARLKQQEGTQKQPALTRTAVADRVLQKGGA
jgi:transposase InsO family protein